MKSPNISYIPTVDHLRGYAAALIVFFHGLHLISYEMTFNAPFSFSPWPQTNNPFLAVLIERHTAVALFMILNGSIIRPRIARHPAREQFHLDPSIQIATGRCIAVRKLAGLRVPSPLESPRQALPKR